jgi:hypothetical protein
MKYGSSGSMVFEILQPTGGMRKVFFAADYKEAEIAAAKLNRQNHEIEIITDQLKNSRSDSSNASAPATA